MTTEQLQQNGCRGMKVNPHHKNNDVVLCWTCGHHAKTVDRKCVCCHSLVRVHNDSEIIGIKLNLDEVLQGKYEPMYRFEYEENKYWIHDSLLKKYPELKKVDKNGKNNHIIKKEMRQHGKITFVKFNLTFKSLMSSDKEIEAIKQTIVQILKGQIKPEYRFFHKGNPYWIKESLLKEYADLMNVDKQDKYYHWIKSVRDSGRLSFLRLKWLK